MVSRIIAIVACFALLPLAASAPLRFFYQQWVAVQLAKLRDPSLVVIGDSIAAGAMNFGRIDTINLASNGLETRQIAMLLAKAKSYRPERILTDGGMNDAISGPIDIDGLHKSWRTMCAEPTLVVALPTPTRSHEINARLATIRTIIRSECTSTIDAPALTGPDGLLKPEYSVDGVHLRSRAYQFWIAALH